MGNQEHLDLLKQSVEQWNRWRWLYPNIPPNLEGVDLMEADLREANLNSTNLSSADLSRANLTSADLSNADLSSGVLFNTTLNKATLNEANLNNSSMIGAHLLGTTLNGADLSNVDLRVADLSMAKLIETKLIGARMGRAILIRTDLSRANLSNSALDSADLRNANLSGANLSGVDLSKANLSGADLSKANLSDANLYRSIVGASIFTNLNLRKTKGLAEIIHRGPSYVALYSIQLPQGGSALHFLRGVGVPDEWIDIYRTMMMHPIQYHSCFISYSSKDEILARRLHADLQDRGVRCWFALEDLRIGDRLRVRIDEAIHVQDKLLLLLSKHAIQSRWVEDEVEAALEKERRQHREVLFPVRLDEQVMQTSKAWAAQLRRTRHIGDFTQWTDPQAYQRAFDRLLRDLKADAKEKAD